MANIILMPIIKNTMHKDIFLLSKIIQISNYFDISFPILIAAGFVLLYKKYYKLSKLD